LDFVSGFAFSIFGKSIPSSLSAAPDVKLFIVKSASIFLEALSALRPEIIFGEILISTDKRSTETPYMPSRRFLITEDSLSVLLSLASCHGFVSSTYLFNERINSQSFFFFLFI
jgi:hypothetical protein